jgi:phosphate transport system protein
VTFWSRWKKEEEIGRADQAIDAELDALRGTICEMGGLAEAAIREAMAALVRRDAAGAAAVVRRDRKIDGLQAEIERRAVEIIGARAPRGEDLREVVAALKIAGVVERIGDYSKNIAKRVASVEESGLHPLLLLPEMSRIAAEMVHDVLDAFAARDPRRALRVCARDAAVDDCYNSIFRALLAHMKESPQDIIAATHLLFIAKNLERIGDHATNVAEMVYFAATGEHLADRPKGADVTAIGANGGG